MGKSPKRLTRDEYVEAILLFLYQSERPSHSLKDIADAVGVAQATISGYVLYALAPNYVVEQPMGPVKAYYLSEDGQKKAKELLETPQKS